PIAHSGILVRQGLNQRLHGAFRALDAHLPDRAGGQKTSHAVFARQLRLPLFEGFAQVHRFGGRKRRGEQNRGENQTRHSRVVYNSRAFSTALSSAPALFIVSSHSFSGTESATMPAPTCR